jgi:putative transposase
MPGLSRAFEHFILHEYHQTPHSATGLPPQARWHAGGFLPQLPESLEQLDLLLLTVAKPRKVRRDGIWFLGLRYLDATLAAYVGESVLVRYDPRDVAEVRVFYQDRFLCRAICQELAEATVPLRDIIRARNRHRRALRQTIEQRPQVVDALVSLHRGHPCEAGQGASDHAEVGEPSKTPAAATPRLKRYYND